VTAYFFFFCVPTIDTLIFCCENKKQSPKDLIHPFIHYYIHHSFFNIFFLFCFVLINRLFFEQKLKFFFDEHTTQKSTPLHWSNEIILIAFRLFFFHFISKGVCVDVDVVYIFNFNFALKGLKKMKFFME
jgi:hypothetical protein